MLLEAEGISKQFIRKSKGTNIFTVIDKTDFILSEGKLTMLSGRSGSGKSTFLNIMSGILSPTTGKVLADGDDIYEMDDEKLSSFRNSFFGFVPQGQSAIRSLTLRENVMLPYMLYNEEPEREEYVDFLLEQMGIAELKNVMPNELSGGEMRRMAIARALVKKPKIIFADEPTGDLDDDNTEIVLKLLKKVTEEGTSVLLVTHENEAVNYADIIYNMNAGKINKKKMIGE